MLGSFYNLSDRYWIDPKHISDRLFVFVKTKGSARYAYRIERVTIYIEHILEENIMKTLIGPLAFLNLNPLLFFLFFNAIFDFWIFY